MDTVHQKKRSSRKDVPVIAGLLLLSLIPFVAGVARLVGLAGGAPVNPQNARFFAMPLPVIFHIVGATLFCVLGAFQFATGFRQRRPAWHRRVGWVLAPAGIVAAFSGLWMTLFYPLEHLQGQMLWGFRIQIGLAMVLFIVLSILAIIRRDVTNHRAWMIRAYAIGQGAGTQAVTGLLWLAIVGQPSEFTRDLLLIVSWIINLAVGEFIIRKRSIKTIKKGVQYEQ